MDTKEVLQVFRQTIEAQAKTIERLADALESVLAYADTVDEGITTPEEYKPMIDARALLAEIRGKHE